MALVFLIIFSNIFVLLQPRKVEATIPVFDKSNMGYNIGDATTQKISLGDQIKNTIESTLQTITLKLLEVKEYILDTLAWTAAQVIIDKFTDSLVMWIQSGFQGSPMFVTNPERFLAGVANDVSGAFIDEFNLEFLCTSLGEINLDLSFFFPGTSRSKYNCTFSDIVENFKNLGIKFNINVDITQENIVREYQKDFRNGGWPMWLAMAQPENNPDARLLQATEDVWSMSEEKKEEERQTIQRGKGFLGLRVCARWESGGNVDTSEEGLTSQEIYNRANSSATKCIEWKTTTPGAIIEEQLSNAVGSDLSRLHLADEINEVIGALAVALVGWVVTGGSTNDSGLLGYEPQADNRQKNRNREQKKNTETIRQKTDIIAETDEMKKWETMYRDATEDQWESLRDTLTALKNIKTKLECINDHLTTASSAACDSIDQNDIIITNKIAASTANNIADITDRIQRLEGEAMITSTTASVAIAVSDKVFKILSDFNAELLLAATREEINDVKDKYCYAYDKSKNNGAVCETEILPPPQAPKITNYSTHSKDEAEKAVAKNTDIRIRMDDILTKYECVLNGYTGVIDAKCKE